MSESDVYHICLTKHATSRAETDRPGGVLGLASSLSKGTYQFQGNYDGITHTYFVTTDLFTLPTLQEDDGYVAKTVLSPSEGGEGKFWRAKREGSPLMGEFYLRPYDSSSPRGILTTILTLFLGKQETKPLGPFTFNKPSPEPAPLQDETPPEAPPSCTLLAGSHENTNETAEPHPDYEVILCPNCQKPLNLIPTHCWKCGSPLQDLNEPIMACANCKQIVGEKPKYCNTCGASLVCDGCGASIASIDPAATGMEPYTEKN